MNREQPASERVEETPVILVTGGARRIGAAIVRRFHERGYRVLIHCRHSLDEARQLQQTLNSRRRDSAACLQADLGDAQAVAALADCARARFGRLDVLVNNASRFYPLPLEQATQQHWDELIDSNVRAAYFLIQALLPALRERDGNIVNLVDINADRGMAGYSIYAMAKSAMKSMTRSLARELAPAVRVNAVAPGAILWPEHPHDPAGQRGEQQRILETIALGRLGSPEEIAETVHFLAATAHYMTGQTIRVDGGRSLS